MFARLRLPKLSRPSRKLIGYLAVWLPIASLFFWRISSLTTGLGPAEVAVRRSSQSLSTIFHNPVGGPFKLAEYVVLKVSHSPWALRGLAVFISLVLIFSFWRVACDWFGGFVGGLSTILLSATSWLAVDGRLADGNNWLLAPIGLLALFLWLRRTKHTFWASLMMWLALGLAIYIPGLIWLGLFGMIVARHRILAITKQLRTLRLLAGPFIFLLVITPLIWSLVENWHNLKTLLLIPEHFNDWLPSLKNIGQAGLSTVWQTPVHLAYSVGRWPMLSVMQLGLAVFGLVVMWGRARQVTYGILSVLLLAIVGAGLNQQWSLLFLALPPLAILQAAGLRYLFLEWRTVFPRNPFAQSLASLMLIVLVLAQLALAGYFALETWPHLSLTQSVYVLK